MNDPGRILDLIEKVANSTDSGEVLALAVETAHRLCAGRSTYLAILDSDAAKLPVRYRTGSQAKFEYEATVPIRDRNGRMRGILGLDVARGPLTDEESRVLAAIGNLILVVLEQRDRLSREEALIQIGTALDSMHSEEALVDGVIKVAREVLSFQACSIFLLDPATDTFVLRGTVGELGDFVDRIGYSRGEGFTGWVCDRGQPILLTDPQDDPRWRGKYVEIPSEAISSFLAVPIVGRTESFGAIRVLRRKAMNPEVDNRFTLDDLRLMQTIAEQVAIGLENIHSLDRIVRTERMAAWGELSAKSSHMIGNRVFALRGDINELSHLVREVPPDVEAISELQKSLKTNVSRIEEILQDFRDFVTATQLTREPTDLNKVVSETVNEVFPRRTDVQLELDLAPDLPLVLLDAKKFRRAVSELIENALIHMDQGTLQVKTSLASTSDLPMSTLPAHTACVRLDIVDSGPGIEPERKSLIFQPFHSGRVRGMGLGLSIVKGIIDAHEGEVFEIGTAGKGANFVIVISY